MNKSLPPLFQRRILLAVTGLSPQIVTETVYALFRQDTPFIPSEIHLITTVEGAERARLSLLSESPGWFHRFCRDYALPPIHFDFDNIHVLQNSDGIPLTDIRNPEENLLAADFITEKVRDLSADSNAALHVSIAGGRKTMGFFLGYALSLFGRPQDRLSHVLVSAPFENSWQFFYPTPYEHIIETHDKKLVDAREAVVSLAEIPFVSLRHGLPDDLLDGRARYADTVDAARANLGPLSLAIDLAAKQITTGGRVIRLPPAELALLALLARRAINGEEALPVPAKEVGDPELGRQYLAEIFRIKPYADPDDIPRNLENGMDGDTFSQHMSKLRRALGKSLADKLIDDGGKRPKRYRLKIAPENIRFV
jgi:CRISPR-associated protein (TIGR02584 family)